MTILPPASIVNLQNISKTYSNGVAALKSVNMDITEGEIVGVVGANGSGKSTLLKVIAGNVRPEQGLTEIFQLNVQKQGEQLKKQISYISQDKALDPEMTGKELLNYFSALYGLSSESAKQRYDELVKIFELSEFIKRRVNTYSGGQAQRLHLAIGIIHQPKLLLLDEPTSALDPSGKAFFWDFIRLYQKQGNTSITISHELQNVRQHCSRILFFDKGSIIANAEPDSIIQSYAKPVLHIKTDNNLTDKNHLIYVLQQSISFASIQFKGKNSRLELNQGVNLSKSKILATVLQSFQGQQLAVTECRWEEASLENAYFKLTGQTISTSSKHNNKKGQRKHR